MTKTNKVDAVYIHVPFCRSICNYCDFCKIIYNKDMADRYISALYKEAKSYPKYKVNSVYLGGGTPTCLSNIQFEQLLKLGKSYLDEDGEYCVEINPESLDLDKVNIMLKYGINRVSLGVQTFNDKYLLLSNRRHKKADVINAIKLLKDKGIDNISVDLMFGFPNQTKDELKNDLEEFAKLDITHISTYPLVIENNTVFAVKGLKALDGDTLYAFYEIINEKLKKEGFIRYEISNFAKDGKVSHHNLKYWKDEQYLGLGPGASGYVDDIRYDNTKSISDYILGKTRIEEHKIEGNEKEFEYIMLNLRLYEGIYLIDYKDKFGVNFLDKYQGEIEKLKKGSLVCYDDKHFYITDKGVYLSNYIISELTINLNY